MLQKPGSSSQPRKKSSRKLTAKESPDDTVKRLQRSVPANKKCADCTTMFPQVVNLTHGTFVCLACSGVHREYSHRMKGIGASCFTEEEVVQLEGNEATNLKYMAKYDSSKERMKQPENNNDLQLLRVWIRRKYVEKAWYKDDKEQENSSFSPAGPTRVKIPPKSATNTKGKVQPVAAASVEAEDLLSFVAPTATNSSWDAFGTSNQQSNHFAATFSDSTPTFQQPQQQHQSTVAFQPNFDQVSFPVDFQTNSSFPTSFHMNSSSNNSAAATSFATNQMMTPSPQLSMMQQGGMHYPTNNLFQQQQQQPFSFASFPTNVHASTPTSNHPEAPQSMFPARQEHPQPPATFSMGHVQPPPAGPPPDELPPTPPGSPSAEDDFPPPTGACFEEEKEFPPLSGVRFDTSAPLSPMLSTAKNNALDDAFANLSLRPDTTYFQHHSSNDSNIPDEDVPNNNNNYTNHEPPMDSSKFQEGQEVVYNPLEQGAIRLKIVQENDSSSYTVSMLASVDKLWSLEEFEEFQQKNQAIVIAKEDKSLVDKLIHLPQDKKMLIEKFINAL